MRTGNTYQVTTPMVLIHTYCVEPDRKTGVTKRRKLDDVVAQIYDSIYKTARMYPKGTRITNQFMFDVCDDYIDVVIEEINKLTLNTTPRFLRKQLEMIVQPNPISKIDKFTLLIIDTV